MQHGRVAALVEKHYKEAVALRRDIHSNPERSNNEYETTAKIKRFLTYPGIEIEDYNLNTGVVAFIRGHRKGKTAILRADIDALPLRECTALPFASQLDASHSCGHDMHTAALALCARVLADMCGELNGNARLVFQPAEETLDGAAAVIHAGILDTEPKPDYGLSLHCYPGYDSGCISIISGIAATSADSMLVRIKGRGGHAAHPEMCIDPITPACDLVIRLHTMMEREKAPATVAVLGIGSIVGGTAHNVIPDEVVIKGTLRTFDEKERVQIKKSIERVIAGTASVYGVSMVLEWGANCPVLYHDPSLAAAVASAAEEWLGSEHVISESKPSIGSEDFSYFGERIPVLQFRLGTGSDMPGGRLGVHNSGVTFDETAIKVGAGVMTWYLLNSND